jgi:hypothetical protein
VHHATPLATHHLCPLLSPQPCPRDSPLSPDHDHAIPWPRRGQHCQAPYAPRTPRRARARMITSMDAPVHHLAPSPPSSPRHQRSPVASPRHQLAARHALSRPRAMSPSSSSTTSAGPVADVEASRAIPSTFLCASKHSRIAMMPATPRRPHLAPSQPRTSSPWMPP